MIKENPIGVFDSGVGGLSVLKQFVRFLPYEKYIYLGDTARVPYGNKSEDTVKQYAVESAEFLLEKQVKMIVIACNTVSSLAIEEVRKISPVPVIGMIVPAAGAAIRATTNGKIGVIGTRATINSDAYALEINNLSNSDKINVYSQSCPLFVPIVEEGWLRHQATKMIAEEYLANFKQEMVDTLVLGCTHYPLLSQLISEIMPGVSLIDSGEHAAVSAIRTLGERGELREERDEYVIKPEIDFYVTDVYSTFYEVAQRFLGFSVDKPEKVLLEKHI